MAIALAFAVALVLSFLGGAHAGSTWELHEVTNATDQPLDVSFYIGYPTSKVYFKSLAPGERLKIERSVESPSDTYLLEVVGKKGDSHVVLLRKLFTWSEIMKEYDRNGENGIVIKPEDLQQQPKQ